MKWIIKHTTLTAFFFYATLIAVAMWNPIVALVIISCLIPLAIAKYVFNNKD